MEEAVVVVVVAKAAVVVVVVGVMVEAVETAAEASVWSP